MKEMQKSCDEYSKNAAQAVEEKIGNIRNQAAEKSDAAVDAVIRALI